MSYKFGTGSRTNLSQVHPILQAVFNRAIEITEQDFGVYEGLRTAERQQEYLRRGVTKTLKSKHLRQSDGYGHAVDAVPFIDGVLRWEWPPIYVIAAAVAAAAVEQGVADKITWGGVWDKRLSEIAGDAAAMKKAVEAYCARHPGPDFIDGPHFELRS